jgi:hypothetical protein
MAAQDRTNGAICAESLEFVLALASQSRSTPVVTDLAHSRLRTAAAGQRARAVQAFTFAKARHVRREPAPEGARLVEKQARVILTSARWAIDGTPTTIAGRPQTHRPIGKHLGPCAIMAKWARWPIRLLVSRLLPALWLQHGSLSMNCVFRVASLAFSEGLKGVPHYGPCQKDESF